jgi:hypothetical protein
MGREGSPSRLIAALLAGAVAIGVNTALRNLGSEGRISNVQQRVVWFNWLTDPAFAHKH